MTAPWKTLVGAGWSVRKAVELAAAIEERGEQTYRALAQRWAGAEGIRTLFEQFAGEEAAHGAGIRKLLATAPAEPASALDTETLRGIAHGFFSDEGWALGGIEQLDDRRQILGKVLRFENATLHFYRGLQDVLGASPTLAALIAEEKRHVVELLRAVEAEDAAIGSARAVGATGSR